MSSISSMSRGTSNVKIPSRKLFSKIVEDPNLNLKQNKEQFLPKSRLEFRTTKKTKAQQMRSKKKNRVIEVMELTLKIEAISMKITKNKLWMALLKKNTICPLNKIINHKDQKASLQSKNIEVSHKMKN